MKRFKRYKPLLVLILGIALNINCAAPPISKTTFSGTSAAQSQEKQGLEVQAEIVTDKAKLKDLFGVESLGNDILAVHARVTNLREGKTYIVQPQSFRLFSNQTSNTGQIAGKGKETGDTLVTAGSVLGIASGTVAPIALAPIALAMIFAGLSKHSQATVVKNNVTRREFKSATLQKGESTSGFLFFQVPKEQAAEGIKLTVNITEAGTTSCETFELNLYR